MKHCNKLKIRTHRGIALVAVLWIVAALSIIAAGVSRSVRSELRQVGVSRDMVESRAKAEAALTIVLQEITASAQRPNRTMNVSVSYAGQPVEVEIMPINGLIDINKAPPALLSRLLEVVGGVSASVADEVAGQMVAARISPGQKGQPALFDATEDLLRVPGIDYERYARLAPLITVDAGGGGRVNPMAAPIPVLEVLAGGNTAAAVSFASNRAKDIAGLDATMFEAGFVDRAISRRFQMQALVPAGVGASLRLTCSVDLTPNLQNGMPWRILHCKHRFQTNIGQGALG